MSIAQVKKRVAEMEAYLGKDKEGIKRLKLLKDEVNVLRKSLAASEDATQLAVTIKDAARERADAAEAALKESQLDNQSLRHQVASLMRDLDTVTRSDTTEADDKPLPSGKSELSEMKAVMKALRRKLQHCPAAINRTMDMETVTDIYNRDDIATGWSHESMWVLGATVAMNAAILGQVAIRTGFDKGLTKLMGPTEDAGMIRHVLDWYDKYNKDSLLIRPSTPMDALLTGTVRVKPYS